MGSGSTTTTVRVYPIKAADAAALTGGDPHPTEGSAAGVSASEPIIVRVPPHPAVGSRAVLGGVLPRTGVTIAVLLALVAVVLIAAGSAVSRVARRRARGVPAA
jgi:LPXTG-motif cell wall-anchored protein